MFSIVVVLFGILSNCVVLGQKPKDISEGLSLNREGYCQIHENHTLCLHQNSVSQTCGGVIARGLSQAERELVTRLHNERRSFIAMGLEKRGDPGPQPSAANMMQLTYDMELEIEAQSWADQCVRGHECPECRTLPRFKNLYWYGHFIGSWEDSIKGWYDEVADFNSSFVYPFYVIPGVLVGHFTQMTWAQTTKVGCGKLFANQRNSRYGQEFYVCNYGLAGNLIKSEMYKKGTPCSACPRGTGCSDDFPGLCKGVPFEPLTVKPPIFDEVDFPNLPSESYQTKERKNPKTIVLPPIRVQEPTKKDRNDSCIYTCKSNLGCSVRFSTVDIYSGSVIGSCFPPDFGGGCSGTPERCEDCKFVCKEQRGVQVVVEFDEQGTPGKPVFEPLDSSESDIHSSQKSDTCSYNCQAKGGCSVRINSNRFIAGSVLGSCFSRFFGGECSGIPKGCRECLDVCEEHKLQDEQIVLPAE